jgi:hypothetical protein
MSKEAYIWLIDKILAANPTLLSVSGDHIIRGLGRNYFERSPRALFSASPHLAEDRNLYEPVSGGWFANVNMDNRLKRVVLRRLARAAGFTYGVDWTWDDGARAIGLEPGKPIVGKILDFEFDEGSTLGV